MKRMLLLAGAALCVAAIAFAQGGSVVVTMDPLGTDCNLTDPSTPALCSYYVVHVCSPGATGIQYKINSGHTGTAFPDAPVFPVTIGSAATGVSIGYGECLGGVIHTLSLQYFCQGTTPPCSSIDVVGHPTATPPGLLAVSCEQSFVDAEGRSSSIEPDQSCVCDAPDCGTIPVEASTWGNIKALWRE